MPQYVVPSATRAKPVPILLDYTYGNSHGGTIRVRAPHAGTWWFQVEFPPYPGTLSKVRFNTVHSGAPDLITLVQLDDDGERSATRTSPTSGIAVLELPEVGELPRTYLLRVSTRGAIDFRVGASRAWRDLPPVQHPECDRDNIDPSNPNCEGVYPRCQDLNKPDYSNPNCCEVTSCILGRHACRAKVISGGPRYAKIDFGADKRLMRFARGQLYQRRGRENRMVSEILVHFIEEREAAIEILSPKNVDMTTFAENNSVLLLPPEECQRRR